MPAIPGCHTQIEFACTGTIRGAIAGLSIEMAPGAWGMQCIFLVFIPYLDCIAEFTKFFLAQSSYLHFRL